MIVALISDVHGNYHALKSVSSILNADRIISAGDVVGYYSRPDDVVDFFISNKVESISGNHDRAVISGDTSSFNESAAVAVEYTRKNIKKETMNYLRNLPGKMNIEIDGLKILVVHGSPYNDDEYIFPDDVRYDWINLGVDIIVLGHTHCQWMVRKDNLTVINPGSIGQPRDGDPRAAFAILNTENKKIEMKRISYDVNSVVKETIESGLPQSLSYRLIHGF